MRNAISSGSRASATIATPRTATSTPRMRGMVSTRNTVTPTGGRQRPKRESGPRMRFLVDLLEALHAGVRVDLRGRDRRVAEQLLHGAKIRTVVEQMRGKGVSQGVRREASVLVDLREKGGDDLLNHPHAHPLARPRQKVCPSLAARTRVPHPLSTL